MRQRIGRRLISIMLSVLMLVSLLPTAVFAEELQDQPTAGVTGQVGEETGNTVKNSEETKGASSMPYVAKVGDNEYATLGEAIAAAEDKGTIILNAESYDGAELSSLSNTNKAVTIKAAEGVTPTFDMPKENGKYVAIHNATVTFEGITFKYGNADYVGLAHAADLTYNSCTIEGKVFLYAKSETFNNCTFKQTTKDYNVWTYGAMNVEFNNCTFENAGKTVNVYIERGNASTEAKSVKVEGCTVNSTADNKAFLNIKNSTQSYDVTFTGTNTVKINDVAVADKLYQVDQEEYSETAETTLTVKQKQADGNYKTLYEVKAPVVDYIDLDTFIKWLENNSYSVDGASYTDNRDAVVNDKLVVKWSPVSGCYDNRGASGHNCTVNNVAATGNTPLKVNSHLAQFSMLGGATNVTVKNVRFVYEAADFTICANSGWACSETKDDVKTAQLYLQNSGNTAIEGCEFDNVVFTSFDNTGSTTIANCQFKNIYNAYAIKDLGGSSVSVTGSTFENCGGGVMLNSNTARNASASVTITGNTFTKVDVAGTAAGGKAGTRGLIQIAKSGTYTNTNYDFSNNTANNCGPVLRQLNESVKLDKTDTENLERLGNTLYTSDSKQAATVDGVVYPTLELAFAALNKNNYKTLEITDGAWTKGVVYWAAGTQSGYAATLAAALTEAYKANASDITIVCRPGADVGTMTHGHVADNITIYGNDAYISGGECDLEVDTFKFSRTTGKQANDGESLMKDITITAYELDNLGVWGQRNTNHTINVNLTDCDGKAIAGMENVQRVYISNSSGVTSSVNNITLKGCDFLTAKTAVYSNANGTIGVDGCSFTGTAIPVNINHDGDGAVTVVVKDGTFTNCGDKGDWKNFAAPIRFVNSGSGTMDTTVDSCTFEGTVGKNGDILIGDGRAGKVSNDMSLTVKNTDGWVQAQKPGRYDGNKVDSSKRVATEVDKDVGLTTSIKSAFIKDTTGTRNDPYTLEQLSEMTRDEYIAAQNRLGGTMYVTVGNYEYDTNGVLGNGVRNDTPGQTPDHSKLNSYAENGYLGEGNDGANGKNIVFVNGSITSNVYGYTSIDNIGTSLLLAVPAYTNVTFEGITFNNVMSFDYQLYTSPWSQLGELKFENCVFEGIIVGAIAAQELTFDGCRFEDYENSKSENNSNPTWIRPAYGNWTKGDNEGQGNDFRSLTKITFTNNTVTSTRPVKFERIAQWEMATTVTATGNTFTINKVQGDTDTKNVGMYFGANAKFDLVVDNNTAKGKTAGLYTAVYSAPNGKSYAGLPAGSTVKDANGNNIEKGVPALEWKSTKPLTLKTTEEVAQLTTTKGVVKFTTLQEAIAEAKDGDTVTLLKDVTENVEIAAGKELTLDLNGCTLNGGTSTDKAALTNYGTITITDSSEGKTGTIKRDDNGTVGETSYYVIRNQGTMTIESGTVSNNSGYRKTNPTGSMIGSSLICNGDCDEGGTLTIKGGTFTQNNFIAIKNGALGVLHVSGGTISSDHSAIQNWFKADITGGEIKGQLWTDAWKEGESVGETKIGGDAKFTGEIVMDITGSVAPTLAINGGNLNVTNWRITSAAATAGAKPAISGGTFNAPVKPEYCVPNHEPVKNSNGTYTVTHFNVAEIDGTEYETLQEAFDAVSATGTIELLHDVTVTSTVKFDKAGKNITIDLQSHKITGDKCRALHVIDGTLQINNTTANNGEAVITSTGIATDSSVIRVGDGNHKQAKGENMKSPKLDIAAGVTVKAVCSYGITVFGYGEEKLTVNGNVISTAPTNASYDGCAISTVGEDKTTANVTINGGTITAENTNAIYMPSGNLLVYSGAIVRGLTGIYAKSGTVQIRKAEIYGTGEAKGYSYYGNGGIPTGDALVLDSCGYPNGAPMVDYTGAENAYFESTNAKPIGSYATKGNTKVTGFVDKGTFNKAIDSELLAKDFVCVYKEAGKYGVDKADDYVAKVGDIYYATLQDAIDAAQNGATVVLVKDVDLTKTVVVNKTITLDMNGKKLHNTNEIWNDGNWSLISACGGNLTITGNGTFAAKENDCYAVDVQDGAKLVIKDGTFVGNIHAVYVFEGTATIDDGTYSVQQKYSAEKPDEFVLNCYDANRANGTAKIIVNGGTFVNFDPMNNQAEGVGTSFVAAGVGVNYNTDGKFTAKPGMTAQVVDADGKSVKAFEDLADALDAAAKIDGNDGNVTVKMLNDVANETFVMVKAGVTLDLAGKNITGATMLYVTGTIVDTAASATKGAVSAEAYMIASSVGSGYTPIYSGTGYQFYKLGMNIMTKDVSADGATVIFAPKTKNEWTAELNAFRTLLAPGFDTSKVQIVLEVEWGETNTHDSQRFAFNDQYVYKYATEDSWAFSVTMNGLNALSGKVTATAKIITYGADGREMTWLSSDAVPLKGE